MKIQLTTDPEAEQARYGAGNQQPTTALITISDSGRGMSKELIDKLFQRFSRGVKDELILGSGLGLYISRRIVEDHKGKIWAESEGKDKGSKFIVLLSAVKEQ